MYICADSRASARPFDSRGRKEGVAAHAPSLHGAANRGADKGPCGSRSAGVGCCGGLSDSEAYFQGENVGREVNDPRHPLFLGDWKRSIPFQDVGFAQDSFDEPHVKRRITILQAHPEIEELYGHETRSQYITGACVAIQLCLAWLFGRVYTETWVWFFVAAYVIGASVTQILGIILHECTHALVAESLLANKLFGLVANIGIPFPIAMSFRRYHLDHHAYQGVPGKDPDLPLPFELRLIKGHTALKLVWLFFFPVMYVVRGAIFGRDISKWERINIATTVLSDLAVLAVCGWRGLLYLVASLWFGYGIHPAAAHFIQEHYTFADGQETYSYYGSFNKLFLNIGFHNEHHDFTKVAWSKLPQITRLAPEFYNSLAAHLSWYRVIWDFLTKPELGPQSRAARPVEAHKFGRRMIKVAAE